MAPFPHTILFVQVYGKQDDKQVSPLADPVERTVIEYSERSLTVFWPRIIMAKNDKKDI